MRLHDLPPGFADTRRALHRVAVHVVARARQQATGRFGLRVTPGGFGTPAFGDAVERVRVSHGLLVRETAGPDGASSTAIAIAGSSLLDLARVAGVHLAAELDIGHDTPETGDVDVPLAIDDAAARLLGAWFSVVSEALDTVVAARPDAGASTVQLWPEHFDVAIDLAFDDADPATCRVNLGGSPGDDFHADPYLYVGPWTDDRPGDPSFWNAPFGAVLPYSAVATSGDPVGAASGFLLAGLDRLSR